MSIFKDATKAQKEADSRSRVLQTFFLGQVVVFPPPFGRCCLSPFPFPSVGGTAVVPFFPSFFGVVLHFPFSFRAVLISTISSSWRCCITTLLLCGGVAFTSSFCVVMLSPPPFFCGEMREEGREKIDQDDRRNTP